MSEVGAPSSEALVARTLFGTLDAWSIDQHQQALDNYLAQRSKKAGLHAPRIVAAILCLALAERYRQAKQKSDAQALIAKAIDAYPGHSAMLALEKTFDARRPIDWRKILLPGLSPKKRKPKSSAKE